MPWWGLAMMVTSAIVEGGVDMGCGGPDLPDCTKIKREEDSIFISKRDGPCGSAPDGVPQYLFDNCCNALNGATLNVNGNSDHDAVTVDGLPYDCILVAQYFTNDNAGGPVPYACGDACLEYSDLSSDDYNHLVEIYNGQAGSGGSSSATPISSSAAPSSSGAAQASSNSAPASSSAASSWSSAPSSSQEAVLSSAGASSAWSA